MPVIQINVWVCENKRCGAHQIMSEEVSPYSDHVVVPPEGWKFLDIELGDEKLVCTRCAAETSFSSNRVRDIIMPVIQINVFVCENERCGAHQSISDEVSPYSDPVVEPPEGWEFLDVELGDEKLVCAKCAAESKGDQR